MKSTDTSEKGLESLIVKYLTGQIDSTSLPENSVPGVHFALSSYGVGCYVEGKPTDYNRDIAIDTAQLFAFLEDTQQTVQHYQILQ